MAIYLLQVNERAILTESKNTYKKVICAKGNRQARNIASRDAENKIPYDNPENWKHEAYSECVKLDPSRVGVIVSEIS